MRVVLFAPAPLDTVSGGYAYDRRMLEGLRALGHDAQAAALPGAHPLPDVAAEAAARAAWQSLPEDAVPVIDGLALPAFAPLGDALLARGAVALIHHPTALETGRPETEREHLRAIERALLPGLRRVITTSAATAERLGAEFGVARERIAVVVPGTDDAPRSHGSGGPGCALLSVGMLIPRKGHDVLLRALARLFDLDWRLVIAGDSRRDPAHAQTLVALAAELGIAARVRFAGAVAPEELEALWQEADVFALATRWEGYGMAVAEALKRGLPVAVTAGGAAGELVPPEAGVVCPPDDVEQFSKALRRLIFDTALRQAMAEAAWQAGTHLPSWAAQARAFAEALV